MPLRGVNIACGYARIGDGVAIMAPLAWSRTMTDPGVTNIAARAPARKSPGDILSTICFEVIAGQDVWIAWGTSPDATQVEGEEDKARLMVRRGEVRTVFCNAGDRLAWVLV